MAEKRNIKGQILKLRMEGKSYREIQKEIGCSKGNVWFHCNNHGLNDTGKKRYALSEKNKIQIANYCLNHTSLEASKFFNLSIQTIKKYRKYIAQDDKR